MKAKDYVIIPKSCFEEKDFPFTLHNIKSEAKQLLPIIQKARGDAYEKGMEHEENTIIKWILNWNGKTNSTLGKILDKTINQFKIKNNE